MNRKDTVVVSLLRACWLFSLLLAVASPALAARSRKEGFVVDRILTGQGLITALAFAPDGTLFFTDKTGTIKVLPFGTGTPRTFGRLSVYSESECGLLGIALDPTYSAYGQGGFVYVFATISQTEQLVIRFTDSGGKAANRADLKSKLPTFGANHDGGCLKIGPDGKIYIAIGDGGWDVSKAQDVTSLLGKVMRLNLDGSTPDDNPDLSAINPNFKREIFAYGFRNPFRIAIRPTGPLPEEYQVWVNDVGSSGGGRREEVNLVVAGRNYGWPRFEGVQTPANPLYMNPTHDYYAEGSSIVGGTFYQGTLFPAEYRGDYFYMDYGSNSIFRMELSGDVKTRNEILIEAEGYVVDLIEGPDGALYYSNASGEIYRIRHEEPGNTKPNAQLSGMPLTGSAPLSVTLDSSSSSDTDGKIIRYDWSFGDSVSDLDGPAQANHVYTKDGTYRAQVTVRDDKGGSGTASVTVTVSTPNDPPIPVLLEPAEGSVFDAGATVSLSGRATDTEDLELLGESLRWDVTLHHNDHTHPFITNATGATGDFRIPEAGIEENWSFRINFTATDSKGKSATVERTVYLNYSPLGFLTDPPGLRVTADGVAFTTPHEAQAVKGARVEITATSPQDLPGSEPGTRPHVFKSWSDGGAGTHTVTMRPDLKLTAVFELDPGAIFLRGDSNQDGIHTLADGVYTLHYLFLGGPAPPCPDASDSNDDGLINVSDPIAGLRVLFLGQWSLPEPSAAPGFDPTGDDVRCRS